MFTATLAQFLSMCGHSTMLYRVVGTFHWGVQQKTGWITQRVLTEPQITPAHDGNDSQLAKNAKDK